MIYFFYGLDTKKLRSKMAEVRRMIEKRHPGVLALSPNTDEVRAGTLLEYCGNSGLFAERSLIVLDQLIEDEEIEELVSSQVKDLEESENFFFIIEKEPSKDLIKILDKKAQESYAFDEIATMSRKFNAFSLTDALGKRDKKNLWLLYQEALRNSVAPEEIHPLLLWQVRTMLLVKISDDKPLKSLKPFVASKAKMFAENFSLSELKKLLVDLTTLYHEARRGRTDFEHGLERFLLSM